MVGRTLVKIAVVGDAGVGKTSLISTAANDTFDARPVPMLPPTRLPAEFTPDQVPMVITDTSSRPEDQQVTDLVIQASDVVVVCFDATRQSTLDSIPSHWYGRIQGLNAGVPVLMACCKADRLDDEREVNMLRDNVDMAVHDLPHVEVCLNCSAKTLRMVADVFYYALKSVLYPLQPLYDRIDRRLRPNCVRALKRVFVMCDADGDGALSDAELNAFQLACFGMALDEAELLNVKQIVATRMPAGVSHHGVSLEGFLFLHVLFIERGRLESTWAVLRKFGYNDEVLLSDEVLDRVNFNIPPDQVWELSDPALEFLVNQFSAVDDDADGLITWQQLDSLCSTIPPPVWQGEPWAHLLVPGIYGAAHKMEAFLLKWQLSCMLDPRTAYAHLLYLGFGGPDGSGGPALLARGVRRKCDKRHRAELLARSTIQCLVFGSKGSGKTSLLRALVGEKPVGPLTPAPGNTAAADSLAAELATEGNQSKHENQPVIHKLTRLNLQRLHQATADQGISEVPSHTMSAPNTSSMLDKAADTCWTAVALVKGTDDKDRTLIMHEVGEELEARMLTAAALAAHGGSQPALTQQHLGHVAPLPLDLSKADIAAFVFDCSSPASFQAAVDLLVKVSTYAGDTLPCVLVATKDELAMCPTLEQQVAAVTSELQIQGVVRTSAQLGEVNGLFATLVTAATNPDGWIPETPARKAHRRFVRQVVTGAAAVALGAGAAYLTYLFLQKGSSKPAENHYVDSSSAASIAVPKPTSSTLTLPTSTALAIAPPTQTLPADTQKFSIPTVSTPQPPLKASPPLAPDQDTSLLATSNNISHDGKDTSSWSLASFVAWLMSLINGSSDSNTTATTTTSNTTSSHEAATSTAKGSTPAVKAHSLSENHLPDVGSTLHAKAMQAGMDVLPKFTGWGQQQDTQQDSKASARLPDSLESDVVATSEDSHQKEDRNVGWSMAFITAATVLIHGLLWGHSSTD